MFIKKYDLTIEDPLKVACDGYLKWYKEDLGIIYLKVLKDVIHEHMIDIFDIKGEFNGANRRVEHTILCALLTKYLYIEFPDTQEEVNTFLGMYSNLGDTNGYDVTVIVDIYWSIRKEVSLNDVKEEITRRLQS